MLRALKEQKEIISIKAVLLADIEYTKDNKLQRIPLGTIVVVDTNNSTMYHCGDHITIEPHEYISIHNPN